MCSRSAPSGTASVFSVDGASGLGTRHLDDESSLAGVRPLHSLVAVLQARPLQSLADALHSILAALAVMGAKANIAAAAAASAKLELVLTTSMRLSYGERIERVYLSERCRIAVFDSDIETL